MGRRQRASARPTDGRARAGWPPRALVLTVGVVVLLSLTAVGAIELMRAVGANRLPALPLFSGQPSAVGEHIRLKHSDARGNPRSADAVGALCVAYHADLFYAQAETCYALAESLASSDWRWRYYLALIESERGGGDALITSLRRVLEHAPHFGPAWLRLGDAEFKAGRYDEAEASWRRASAAGDPERASAPPAHAPEAPLAAFASLGLARLALARGAAEQARTILETVTSHTPRFGSAHRLLAESYTALGRHADATKAIYRASRLPAYAPYADPMIDTLARESRNSTFLLRQASEADLGTNAEWSAYLARRAIEVDPDNPDALSKLGRILRTLGRNEEALEFFSLYNAKVPGDFQGLAHIGSCLSDLGRLEEAERYLRRALEGLDDALTHYNLGVVLAATGRVDQAVSEYRHALTLDPDLLAARNNLASALARRGQRTEAVRELQRVLELDPENALARTNLQIIGSLER